MEATESLTFKETLISQETFSIKLDRLIMLMRKNGMKLITENKTETDAEMKSGTHRYEVKVEVIAEAIDGHPVAQEKTQGVVIMAEPMTQLFTRSTTNHLGTG